VSYAIDNHINYFDVAPAYGNAQEIMGNSLKPYRKSVNLACKTNEFAEVAGMAQFQESLRLLHTDYFDVYQLHALTEMSQLEQAFSSNGIMTFLDKAKREGYIKNLGFSSHNENVALKALEYYDFDTVLFPFNWTLNIVNQVGNRILEAAKSRNMGILALKAMAHRLWQQEEPHTQPKCWYKPIELSDDQLLVAAANYTLSMGVHLMLPPGQFEYLQFAVEHFDEIDNTTFAVTYRPILENALQEKIEYIFDKI
jgi:predicted aldo/keto reductase-like oxidoreductase